MHGVERVDGVPLLAMEWVEGIPITAWARERADLREKLEAFLSVCDAVEHAHSRGVIHRDLKPSNVLIDASGRCRVLDFGLARRAEPSESDEAGGPTQTVGFVGTPAYAAPEHFTDGAAPVDARGDVYSLGVVLFELLTGRRPFEAATMPALVLELEHGAPPRPSSLAPALGRELDTIATKAIAADPEARYQTVHSLADDVRRHLDGREVARRAPRLVVPAGQVGAAQQGRRRPRRRPGPLARRLGRVLRTPVAGARRRTRRCRRRARYGRAGARRLTR